jgi:hypothetical protein
MSQPSTRRKVTDVVFDEFEGGIGSDAATLLPSDRARRFAFTSTGGDGSTDTVWSETMPLDRTVYILVADVVGQRDDVDGWAAYFSLRICVKRLPADAGLQIFGAAEVLAGEPTDAAHKVDIDVDAVFDTSGNLVRIRATNNGTAHTIRWAGVVRFLECL